MGSSHQTFGGRLANLDFIMKVPREFVETALPKEDSNFDSPSVCAPLLHLSSPGAKSQVHVAYRPGYNEGTVRQWFEYLTGQHAVRLLSIGPAYVGGLRKNHPAIVATALQELKGTELVMSYVAFEDGGRLVIAHAQCPRELEPRFMRSMEQGIHSIELLHHKGPTADLEGDGRKWDIDIVQSTCKEVTPEQEAAAWARTQEKARDAALQKAAGLIAHDQFDEAARVVFAADDSGKARAGLSELFMDALRDQVRRDGKRKPAAPRALELYRRALQHRLSTYPDPHTQDEADRYEAGMNEDRADVAAVLGYVPE